MYVANWVGNLILSAWIWHMMFDWMHPVVTGIVMFFICRIFLRRSRQRSFLISASAQLWAFVCLTGIIYSDILDELDLHYDMLPDYQAISMLNELYPSLALALLYALFQTLYFALGRIIFQYRLSSFVITAWASNGIGFASSVMMIRMVQYWYYG